jgi:two-component system, LytTR family, sensor kinase
MKRIILLLLVLSCFRFSYGEDLSPEQQKSALDFIHANMLNHENLPIVFHDDIIINLLGKAIREDSIDIQEIIHNIQKSIPNQKIELSNNPGNLKIWINDSTGGFISRGTKYSGGISIAKVHIQIPASYSRDQRKRLIYYDLLRSGLVIYPKPLKKDSQVRGCVFAENDFNSITYSPFDLFILEKIYSREFQLQLAVNSYPKILQSAWNSIFLKFMGETKKPIIYRNDIVIKLDGTPDPVDSACMDELIRDLKIIIPTRNIYFGKENANLIFSFNDDTHGTGTSTSSILYTILKTKNSFQFSPNILKEERKQVLYFYLYRSLIHFSPSKNGKVGIDGCVFDGENSDMINYNPLDAFMLNRLYADDFQEQFKTYMVNHYSHREYLVQMYHNELDLFFQFLGFLFLVVLFTVLIIKGEFRDHKWNWISFSKQGLFLILMVVFYTLCISLSDLKLDKNDIVSIINEVVSLFLVVNLIYLAERLILKNRDLGGSKIIVIFLTTLLLPVLVSLLYRFLSYPLGDFGFSPRYNSLLPLILVASLARCLYVFLNDRYKSIINQKDVELAKISELHKQAELQSLRAKINPHFLYNALNSIASLATTDAQKTEQMALALSDFFKYAINREQKQLNTLSEELNAVRTYLEIEKVRFGDRLNFEIDCPLELLSIQIPQLLIQPLVENAIKHGLSQITENGLIRIAVANEKAQMKIRIYDNGPAFPDGPLTGFGIQNTQERIALLYGAKATIYWQNGAEKYIEINLPLEQPNISK